jgi:nucleoside-diphosphate kinase
MERTLIVMKPDLVQRGIVGEIISRFEKAGLQIVGMKMVAPDRQHLHTHYETISKMISRWGEKVFEETLVYMSEGPVIAVVLEGIDAIAYVRKMLGPVNPKDAVPGTIRADYTHIDRTYSNAQGMTMPNLLHASGNKEEAGQEIKLWFKPDELYEYISAHSSVVRGRKLHADSSATAS